MQKVCNVRVNDSSHPAAARRAARRSEDVLGGAAAEELGAAVIHYDRDYDTLAELMEFESIWLAPPGTLP